MLHGVPTGETIERLTAIPGRGAGTDAERRAALRARARPRRARPRARGSDTYWVRPGVGLARRAGGRCSARAGASPSVAWPLAGLIAAARRRAVASRSRAPGCTSPLRLLTRRRATQNVVSLPGGPRRAA